MSATKSRRRTTKPAPWPVGDAAIYARAEEDGVAGPDGGVQVFVYGSLRQGQGNHLLLLGARYRGGASTADPFRMWHVGFPLILPAAACRTRGFEARVTGEVYEVDAETLDRLDGLESEGFMYDRVVLPLLGTVPPVRPRAYGYVWRGEPRGEPVKVPRGHGCHDWPAWLSQSKE